MYSCKLLSISLNTYFTFSTFISIKKEVVELLLSRDDVDLTLRNDLGETALDLARRYSEFNHLFEERSRRANAGKRKFVDILYYAISLTL